MTARRSTKKLFVALAVFGVCCVTGAVALTKGIKHSLAGLPHWATACPTGVPAILVIGQSQASNTGPSRHISASGSRAFAEGKCYYLRDPMPGTAGRGGSIWPLFADRLGRKVVVADMAISGSAIDEWTTVKQLAKIRSVLSQLRAAGYAEPLIIWMQGETDGARRTSSQEYYAHLQRLLRTAPTHRWLMTRESICYGMQDKWKPLDVARDRIRGEFPKVVIGPDLDRIPLDQRQFDRCHLTMQGQADLADDLAASAGPLLTGKR